MNSRAPRRVILRCPFGVGLSALLLSAALGAQSLPCPVRSRTAPPPPQPSATVPAGPLPALTGPAPRDAAALAIVQQALTALAPGGAPAALELDGTVTYTAGSTSETGTARLVAQGATSSRVELDLSGGQRIDTRSGTADRPQAQFQGEDGVAHSFGFHNDFVPAAWFAPLLTPLGALADTAVGVSYIGAETHNGAATQHLRFYRIVKDPRQSIQLQFEKLSQSDLYLDATTLLPVALDFTAHPDNNACIDLPVEIRFSGYQTANGLAYAGSIQRYVDGTLVLDIDVTSANSQPDTSPGEFSLTSTGGGQ